jgi:hypothetical protein
MRYVYISSSLLVAVLAGSAPAGAQSGQCYEEIGCVSSEPLDERALRRLSCENLWFTRNRVFKDRGFCFKTARAIAAFGNAGCQFDDEASVPLNSFERANIQAIRRAEARKGC